MFDVDILEIPLSPADAIDPSPSSTSPLPPSAQKKKSKCRPSCYSFDKILKKCRSIRQRVNFGQSLLTTVRNLNIPYTKFVRNFKPIWEMEALEPDGGVRTVCYNLVIIWSLSFFVRLLQLCPNVLLEICCHK